ncbi:MAG: hypothetical protein J6Z15_05485 [Oscillospiraceae bacterium]|nr:hypothetical protein [Oscillospiraceae bacterium]
MNPLKPKVLLSGIVLLCLLLLCGCAKKVTMSSSTVKDDAQSITAVVTPEDLMLLDGFESLVSADFSGSTCYPELMDWAKRHPLVEVRYTVSFPGGVTAENSAASLDLTGLKDVDAEEAMAALEYLPQLKAVDLGSEQTGLSPTTACKFFSRYPDLDFSYHCRLFGKDSVLDETEVDLTQVSPKEILASLDTISALRNLKEIRLGDETRKDAPTWEEILALREVAPDAAIDYSFTIFEFPFTLEDEEVDISYHPVRENWPEILAIAKCMPNLKTLLMDSCGVGNEDMATIRDALPDTEVVWRINFGATYSARTNVIKILASKPSLGGTLYNSDLEVFKYFTKIKYLDIGHNETITDLSFVRYMPDLEVLIIAMNPLGDLTPLADCENLEYLELFYSNTDDLSPLAGLKNLKHLNVGHCPHLTDISPIYDLELDRFYLGRFEDCPVPAEQVDHYRELHPDCEVENTSWESSEGAWRRGRFLDGEKLEWFKQQPYYNEERIGYAPRYALLCDQMGYDSLAYTVSWYDPDYKYLNADGYAYY